MMFGQQLRQAFGGGQQQPGAQQGGFASMLQRARQQQQQGQGQGQQQPMQQAALQAAMARAAQGQQPMTQQRPAGALGQYQGGRFGMGQAQAPQGAAGGLGGNAGLAARYAALSDEDAKEGIEDLEHRQEMQQISSAGDKKKSGGGMLGGLLSDAQSKRTIRDLESRLAETHAALTDGHADYPEPRSPDVAALDDSYRRAGSYTYKYRDPSMEGAAPGQQHGPMAHELRQLPGVVQRGGDGYERVDTGRLSLANTSQLGRQRRELDDLNERLAALQDDPDAVLDTAAGRRRR